MCKLAHVIRYTVLSQNFLFFAVLERWLIYDCETECSFVYLILAYDRVTSHHVMQTFNMRSNTRHLQRASIRN